MTATMTAYYNEIEPYAAEWLRNLIKAGHIAPGEVDERSIEDIRPDDLRGFTQCHFFAGVGVWSHALRRAGWPDEKPVWTGSCPCQPFSAAGKGNGFNDERHLWPAWFHLITQLQPGAIFGEQVASKPGLTWFDLVQADLEGAGYTSGAVDICAAGVGAPHIRQRLFWVADANRQHLRGERPERNGEESATEEKARKRKRSGDDDRASGALGGPGPTNGFWRDADWLYCQDDKWRPVEPGTSPLVNGAPGRVGRLRAYGNAINAEVATQFIRATMT